MNKIIRNERLTLTVGQEVMQSILRAESPFDAARIIAEYPCEEAVSIIDNLDPLTAALMISVFNHEMQNGLRNFSSEYAKKLVAKANELQIRGTLGLCHARDEVYRETGFFAGI